MTMISFFKQLVFLGMILVGFIHATALDQSSKLIAQRASTNNSFIVYTEKDFIVAGNEQSKLVNEQCLVITADRDNLIINNKPTHMQCLYLHPTSGLCTYENNQYEGMLRCELKDEQIALYVEYNKKLIHSSKERSSESQSHTVRVLLDTWVKKKDHSETSAYQWQFNSPDGFILIIGGKKIVHRSPTLTLCSLYGDLYLGKKKIETIETLPLVIKSSHDQINFNGNNYRGYFVVTDAVSQRYLINSVNLEDYIYSVLRTESWPGWSLEINKVFAIACRSYALAMVLRSKNNKLPYHIKNTNAHQTYTGDHDSPMLKQAVEQTKGMFLAYNGAPIIAMYDGCCGGIVPAKMSGFDFTYAPYLARNYACTYCKDSKRYAWRVTHDLSHLRSMLAKEYPVTAKSNDIKIVKKDRAGLVQKVVLKSHGSSIMIPGKKIYSLVKGVKSYCFSIQKHGTAITFEGRGYGHHLGLCQWGAYAMVHKGWGYKDVLDYYYPGTKLTRLAYM